MRKRISFLLALLLVFGLVIYQANARDVASTDTAVLGNDQWSVTSDGDLVPNANTYGFGTTSYYVDSLCLGGTCKTSWGSVVSPMTDASGYVYPTDSGAVLRLYDAGYINLGANTAADTYILYDSDSDDWYAGHMDTSNDYSIGYGSTPDTDLRLSVVDSATLTHIIIGDGVDAEDKYIVFDGNAADQYLGYLDTYDMLIAGDGSTMDADMCWGVERASTPLLVLWNGIDGYGAIDIDYGSADITDHTFVSDGGTIVIDGETITIGATNLDTITNPADDTIRVSSDDADTIFEIYTPFDTTGDATLKLSADLGDAAGEQWTITSTGATTDLVFGCDDVASGTALTRFTISDAGVVTTVAAQNFEIDDSANTTVTDVVNIQHFTSGTAAAGIGAGLTFDLENGSGTEEEHASIDVVSAVATNGSEDTDFVINLMTNGALAEVFRIDMDNEADAGAVFELTSRTEETNGVIDILELELDNTLDTANDGMGLGISIQMDDETDAVEEQASMDFVLTDVATTAENVDFVLSLNTIGTIREALRVDVDSTATATSVLEFNSYTLETDGIVDVLELKLDNTLDTSANNFGMGISFQTDDGTDAVEEQASLDIQVTDVTTTAENADIILSANTIGTIREVYHIDTDNTATDNTLHQLTSWTLETNGVRDVLELNLDNTADTATDGFGLGISIVMEQEDAGTPVEQASIDFTLVDSSTGVEDCDVIFSQDTAGTVAETLRLVANSSATTSDYMQFTANTTETTVTHPVLVLATATGTAADLHGVAISFRPEDATSSEEHARIDVTQTTAARATNDTDFIFTQDVNGALEERVRFDADGGTIKLVGTLPNILIGDAGAEDTKIVFDGVAQDYHIGLDDTGGASEDLFTIGKGSALGTTPALTVDANLNVAIPTSLIRPVETVAATETLTENEGFKFIVLAHATEFVTTLPDAASSTGVTFHFVIGLAPSGASYTIVTEGGADEITGIAVVNGATVAADTEDTITFTDGAAAIGDWCELTSDGTTWYVSGQASAATGIAFTKT